MNTGNAQGENLNNRIDDKSLFITGGTGTLGRAIARRARAEKWNCDITVYSRDPVKQIRMKQEYPDVRYVLGDIRDYDNLYRSMVGADICLHLAALKHIPQAEVNPIECIEVNVTGSINVANAAVQAGVKQVVGISTDKVCYPINCYGNTKRLLEHIWQEYNRLGLTTFHLCRYGNVIGSTESVAQVWQRQIDNGRKPTITDPEMTRFWMTEDQAVDVVLLALGEEPGTVVIPLAPALDMKRFAEWLTGLEISQFECIGLRPGEKMHECLLTAEERLRTTRFAEYMRLETEQIHSRVEGRYEHGYHSNNPRHWLTRDELLQMAGMEP